MVEARLGLTMTITFLVFSGGAPRSIPCHTSLNSSVCSVSVATYDVICSTGNTDGKGIIFAL